MSSNFTKVQDEDHDGDTQHLGEGRGMKRYQGIPPAPVVSDVYRVYRSIGLPSKRNPFCNLRHLRFLGFVHFDETCIMIF